MVLSKNWIFNLYFNFKDEKSRGWAERKREESLIYMRKTMERMTQFSVITKDGNTACLLLRGYMHLNNACMREHVKKVLGKYSNCKMTKMGDVVALLRFFYVDRYITLTGELPSQNSRKRDDARWVMRQTRDGSDDFESDSNCSSNRSLTSADSNNK